MTFDKEIDRYHTNSLKYDFKEEKNKPSDVLPMWVADMDFRCCDAILEDMHKKIDHGILGYSKNDHTYFLAIQQWYNAHFHTQLNREWLITTPGVVFALATAVKTLTHEGDYVLINNPVYYPFTEVVEDNNRKIISSDLVLQGNSYKIDFDDFENKIKQYHIKLFLLCSPHNPVGRVWKKEELDEIIKICKKHQVFIASDEIHSDFIWIGTHTCLLKYQDYQDHMILCTAPTKTFNLSGLQISNIFIPNEEVRHNFQLELWNTGYSLINIMGLIACQSAYEKGLDWLNELKSYLLENINYVNTFLKERIPKIHLIYPEGTYLLWLDFREFELPLEELENILLSSAKLWLDSGSLFGSGGDGFQRMNIAMPRQKLIQALENLEKAFQKYEK